MGWTDTVTGWFSSGATPQSSESASSQETLGPYLPSDPRSVPTAIAAEDYWHERGTTLAHVQAAARQSAAKTPAKKTTSSLSVLPPPAAFPAPAGGIGGADKWLLIAAVGLIGYKIFRKGK